MELISISALEVHFDKRPADNVLLASDEFVNILRTAPGCMSYSIIALNKDFSSIIISGFWADKQGMVDHFSSSSFAALTDCLASNCRSMSFRSFFMTSGMRGQHAEQ
ncbi:hypothetical protein D3C77_153800 [compost metagenome]|uniref:antibiotic biosynthesis monooxygenase n=1 Tax=Pseudomonas TaxID=286 RepID=UPI000CFC8B83|nr:antibiotic biosynthesis monooxygenase [Pseudomonas sp. MYb187]PRA60318.1 hypothetical protein CQ065_21245 [Pseudomonas sp. MYb187]